MKVIKQVEADLSIELPAEKDAEIIFNALEPETDDLPSERSIVKIKKELNILKIFIRAQDTTSLRASVNSYLRWIMLSKEILELNMDK